MLQNSNSMRIITNDQIESLHISPERCVKWVKEAFLLKDRCQLPPKVSLHPSGYNFINTMPCLLPEEYHTFGCKIVTRVKGQNPAINSEMMMFNTLTGKMTTLLNADWITAMRTGAVATLAIETLKKDNTKVYSFIGLGVTGNATLNCLLAQNRGKKLTIRLKAYKDHAPKTIERFKHLPDISWEIADTTEDLIKDADVIVSCITEAANLIVEDVNLFKPGVLVVPVHTRGFQNCDTIFDKVFADDEGHVKGFKYFNQFRKFGELGKILSGEIPGRESEDERILSYNIGLGLHDVYFAYQIENLINQTSSLS